MTANAEPLKLSELYDVLYYAPVGVLIEDCEGVIVWLNHMLQWLLGVDLHDVAGTYLRDLPLEPLLGARGKGIFRSLGAGEGESVTQLKCIEDVLPEYDNSGIRVRYFLGCTESRLQPCFQNDLLRLLVNRASVDRTTGLAERDAPVVMVTRCPLMFYKRAGWRSLAP
jgi:hypothetical protein